MTSPQPSARRLDSAPGLRWNLELLLLGTGPTAGLKECGGRGSDSPQVTDLLMPVTGRRRAGRGGDVYWRRAREGLLAAEGVLLGVLS
jgi:hypothetical protein